MEPWQKAITLREAARLSTFIRRWRWALIARTRGTLAGRLEVEFGLTPSTQKGKV